MIVILKQDASRDEVAEVKDYVRALGHQVHDIPGTSCLGIAGNTTALDTAPFLAMSGVEQLVPVKKPYMLVGRDAHPEDTVINVGGEMVGGRKIAVIAGPCSVESAEQLFETADAVKQAGATFLRGGAFKPRSSPYAFQGMKEEGLILLREAKKRTGLKIVTEAKDVLTLPAVAEVADVIQIGARNMQNYGLLEAVGELSKPVLLKRGMANTIEELLMSAEYILARGNHQVMLCERGIRTFETSTRNTLDLNAVPMIKKLSHLPMFVDPSHGIGIWNGVPAMTLAAVAAGADGLAIEVHPDPLRALSDGAQSLKPKRFAELIEQVRRVAEAVGRNA